MLDWMRKLLAGPPVLPPANPDDALAALRGLTSDAAFEDAWEVMDQCAALIEDEVRADISSGQFGSYPMHAAVIWLAYTLGNSGRVAEEALVARLAESIAWAFDFDENTVLLGAALGALDAVAADQREAVALKLFDDAGATRPRRYWLLLKVRSEKFVARVADALRDFRDEAPAAEVVEGEVVYSPTAANRMAGAFRQFEAADFPVIERHFDLGNAGAQFLVEAMGATRVPAALRYLELAQEDHRPAVQTAAERWIRTISVGE